MSPPQLTLCPPALVPPHMGGGQIPPWLNGLGKTLFHRDKLCSFPVRICIPGEAHPNSQWGCAFPVRCIPIPGEDMHSRWGTSQFPVRHIPIPGEAHPHSRWGTSHSRWGCFFLCDLSWPGMGMCLTGNAHNLYRVIFWTRGFWYEKSEKTTSFSLLWKTEMIHFQSIRIHGREYKYLEDQFRGTNKTGLGYSLLDLRHETT